MHEQEQQEDLGVGTSALGFLPATQIEKCLFKVLIVFNDNRALLFCLLALSVRRKWERKFGLFIALPVASDLRFYFVITPAYSFNITFRLWSKDQTVDEEFIRISKSQSKSSF